MAPPWVFVPRGEQEHIYGQPLQCCVKALEREKAKNLYHLYLLNNNNRFTRVIIRVFDQLELTCGFKNLHDIFCIVGTDPYHYKSFWSIKINVLISPKGWFKNLYDSVIYCLGTTIQLSTTAFKIRPRNVILNVIKTLVCFYYYQLILR